jgi:hypothetical protein
MNRLLMIALALFCAAAAVASCKSKGGDSGGQTPQPLQSAGITRLTFLNAKQIVSAAPPVSSATGTAAIALDTATGRLTGAVTLINATNAVTAVHVNDGDAGSNGDLVVSLVETPGGSGTWTIPDGASALTAAQMDRFKAAGFYVIIDTSANADGEIRGQLLSYVDNIQPIFNVNCAGCHYPLGLAAFSGLDLSPKTSYASLVNQPATRSTGARVIPFDADNSVLFQRITGVGFSAIAGPQMPPPGQTVPLLSSREQNLIKVWINSGAMDENGAVRTAQPIPSRQYARNAFLNDKQVVHAPGIVSAATATAAITLDTATSRLTGTVVISNMANAVTAVHINDGDADNNGALVVSLAETPPGSGRWTVPATASALSDLQMNRFISAGFYVSVDTIVNPDGEIRGQFLSYANNVQPLFSARCVQCHNSGLILSRDQSYALLVNQPATQTTGTRVVPFDAANSVLYRRITGIGSPAGFRMPADGPPFLSLREENIIKIWINMGAGNN